MLPTGMIPGSHSLAVLPAKDSTGPSSDSTSQLDAGNLQSSWLLALFAGIGLLAPVHAIVSADSGHVDTPPESVAPQKTATGPNQTDVLPSLGVGQALSSVFQTQCLVDSQVNMTLQTRGQDNKQVATNSVTKDAITLPEIVQSVPARPNGFQGGTPLKMTIEQLTASTPPSIESQGTVPGSNTQTSFEGLTVTVPKPKSPPSSVYQDETSEAQAVNTPVPLLLQPLSGKATQFAANAANAGTTMEPGESDHAQTRNNLIDSGKVSTPAPVHGNSGGESNPAPTADVAAQIGKEITSHLDGLGQQGRTDFHFHLDPPDLGPVRIHLTSTAGVVSARLVVREDSARQILESQMNTLVQRLTDAGVSLGRFDVSREGAGFGQQWQETSAQANLSKEQVPAPMPSFLPSSSPAEPRGLIDLVA